MDVIGTKVVRFSSFSHPPPAPPDKSRSISSNSCNLLQFLQSVTVHCKVVKEKRGKPEQKPYPLSYGLRNPYRTSSLSRLCPETLTKLYVYEFGFWCTYFTACTPKCSLKLKYSMKPIAIFAIFCRSAHGK